MTTQCWWYEKQLTGQKKNVPDDREFVKSREQPHKVVEALQKCRKAKVHYDTGWDTQPFSILKLISDVQAENQRYIQRNLERAVLIVEQSAAREEYRRSLNASPAQEGMGKGTSPNITKNLANLTVSPPDLPAKDNDRFDGSALRTPKPERQSTIKPKRLLGIRDEEYDEEADAVALATQSPIFAQFERSSTEYEKGRLASWISKCREKAAELDALEKRNEISRKQLLEKQRLENEERRKAAALDRNEKRRSMEIRIADQRRRLDQQSEMQEREFNLMRQREEKEKLDKLEEQRRKDEIETAKIQAEENAARNVEEERVRKLNEENQAKTANEQPTIAPVAPAASQHTKQRKPAASRGNIPPEFRGAILEQDLSKYLQSQQLLEQLKEKVAHISSTSERTKSYYSAAMKVVNTPLNAISNLSLSHLQSKINHFLNLLEGKPVYVGETMSTPFLSSGETNGSTFVLNLLAYRFVKKSEAETIKGDKTVGLTPLANLGAQLVLRYPEWGTIVQAYFYKLCPFLVPFNYPRREMTVQEYAFAIGQDLSGNERAIQQVLLERIAGYCTLYVLMVVKYEELGGGTDSKGFFTLCEVWRILSATLKIVPQLDVTATVLHTILETIGDKLAIVYKTQFRKYLQVLVDSYLRKITDATPPGKAAALTRLELFLESKATSWFRSR